MIEAKLSQSTLALARRLAAKAGALGRSHAESHLGSQATPGAQWRKARLLWPLFEGIR